MSIIVDKSRLKPAMHRDLDGRLHPPVKTLGEQLQRAIEPRPRPLDWQHQRRLMATLTHLAPELSHILSPYLRGGEG